MKTYLTALKDVLENGTVREDRTGTGTIGVFGMQQRYDLTKGFPAVTTKRLAFKACLSELLWFLEGSGDERRLAEILHGSSEEDKRTIWTDNALADYWLPKAKYQGDLGRVYGVQWRDFGGVDQLLNLIDGLKNDPYGRRHIITAWNPAELNQMALPPCHCFAQFYVSADNKLSCQMYQRSCDMFLGVPFNVASYSLLTHMIAQVCGLGVGEFVHVLGDAHIYLNHVEQVKEQLSREPLPAPQLWINPNVQDITKFTMEDFRLDGYNPMPSIKAPMAV
jgi:thymidylate synthase